MPTSIYSNTMTSIYSTQPVHRPEVPVSGGTSWCAGDAVVPTETRLHARQVI